MAKIKVFLPDDSMMNKEEPLFSQSLPIENIKPVPGGLQGKIELTEDFDSPMSDEELALWYDSPIFPVDE